MIEINKISEYIYKNINNVWVILKYKWNLLIENNDFYDFYKYLYNLWFTISIWILFRNWIKEYIIEVYSWESWLANNPLVYNPEEVNKKVNILNKHLNKILNLPLLKWKVELIKDFWLFENKIITQTYNAADITNDEKDLLFSITQKNLRKFLWKDDYKKRIRNIEDYFIEFNNYWVDMFNWEEIYWKNIILNNKVFFHYNLIFDDSVYSDLKDLNKKSKYNKLNIINFVEDLMEIANDKEIEFLFFKIYGERVEEDFITNKTNWEYNVWFNTYNFEDELSLLTLQSYKLMFVSKKWWKIQKQISMLEKKYNFKKRMKRDIEDNIVYLQDWNYYNDWTNYSTLPYMKN